MCCQPFKILPSALLHNLLKLESLKKRGFIDLIYNLSIRREDITLKEIEVDITSINKVSVQGKIKENC